LPNRPFALHHKDPVKLQEDDEDVLAGEEDHELVEHLLTHHEVEPVNQKWAILESHGEQQAPHFAGAAGGRRRRSGAAAESRRSPLRRLVLWESCLGQHQRELHERPREEAQADVDNGLVGFDLGLLEGVKDVQDVGAQSHVDHEELGELVAGHVPLGHQPATQNQHDEHGLLQASDPVLRVQLHDGLGEGKKEKKTEAFVVAGA